MSAAPVLAARDVTRTFGDIDVLKPTTCAIHDGDYVAITGPSGSGKSTLMNLFGLLDTPTSGDITVGPHNTTGLTSPQRSALRGQSIGFVFQSFHLLHTRTAQENVELGMLYSRTSRAECVTRARAALHTVGLDHRLDAYPTTLSGGERQRVAIARALAAQPRLLLADEPTGNLDSTTTETILDLFDTLHAAGLTIVTVTHENDVAARATRRFHMHDGRLTEKSGAA